MPLAESRKAKHPDKLAVDISAEHSAESESLSSAGGKCFVVSSLSVTPSLRARSFSDFLDVLCLFFSSTQDKTEELSAFSYGPSFGHLEFLTYLDFAKNRSLS